jgi:glutathione S-transferase
MFTPMMKLYFSPLACSLATRIAVLEAGLTAEFVEVDPKTKRTSGDADYKAINPLGLVPALQLDDGSVLTENAAILQYVGTLSAERGGADLAPRPLTERTRLQQWLSFVGTELHKTVYVPLLTADAPDGAKAFALSRADARLSHVAAHLAGREFLLDRFTVADAYLFAVLNWSQVTPIDLRRWPPLTAYLKRLLSRDAIARAVAEERALYALEQARHAAERRLSAQS